LAMPEVRVLVRAQAAAGGVVVPAGAAVRSVRIAAGGAVGVMVEVLVVEPARNRAVRAAGRIEAAADFRPF